MRRNSIEPDYVKIPPEPLFKFRDIDPRAEYAFPELLENRRCTDPILLGIFTIFMVAMIACILVICLKGDLRRELNGEDQCGNICGVDNSRVLKNASECRPTDYTDFPVLYYSENGTRCIRRSDCKEPENRMIYNRCEQKEGGNTTAADIARGSITETIYYWIGAPLVALSLCGLILVGFRRKAAVAMYAILLGGVASAGATAVVCWYYYITSRGAMYLLPAALSVCYLSGTLILVIFLCNRFKLVTGMLKEAAKMLFASPVLLVEPLVTLGFLVVVNAAVIYTLLVVDYHDKGDKETVEVFATIRLPMIIFGTFALFWCYGFANGCQCMIVGGTVVYRYFSRGERQTRRPYLNSLHILEYHLGTIAAGSLLVTISALITPTLRFLRRNKHCLMLSRQCSEILSEPAAYYSKRAYIMTAIHGRNFYLSGRRVTRLSWLFMCDLLFVDKLACATMHNFSFLVILLGTAVLFALLQPVPAALQIYPILIGMVITAHVTFFCLTLMNVVVDAMVVCFCEDRMLNNGSRQMPFFMSQEFFTLMIDALELSYVESRSHETPAIEYY